MAIEKQAQSEFYNLVIEQWNLRIFVLCSLTWTKPVFEF
jgi:hypothetical protein